MAAEQIEAEASAEAVWEVLADPQAYGEWVVGTQRIRGADDGFPDPGARLYHSVGAGRLSLSDTTSVVEAEPLAARPPF